MFEPSLEQVAVAGWLGTSIGYTMAVEAKDASRNWSRSSALRAGRSRVRIALIRFWFDAPWLDSGMADAKCYSMESDDFDQFSLALQRADREFTKNFAEWFDRR